MYYILYIYIYTLKQKFLHKWQREQSLVSNRAPLTLYHPSTFLTLGNTSYSTPSTLKLLSLVPLELQPGTGSPMLWLPHKPTSGPNKTRNSWAHAAAFPTVGPLVHISPQAGSTEPVGSCCPTSCTPLPVCFKLTDGFTNYLQGWTRGRITLV